MGIRSPWLSTTRAIPRPRSDSSCSGSRRGSGGSW